MGKLFEITAAQISKIYSGSENARLNRYLQPEKEQRRVVSIKQDNSVEFLGSGFSRQLLRWRALHSCQDSEGFLIELRTVQTDPPCFYITRHGVVTSTFVGSYEEAAGMYMDLLMNGYQ